MAVMDLWFNLITRRHVILLHTRLLMKLTRHEYSDNLLKWIEDFLIRSKMRVGVNGNCSEWELVNSEVPQGYVLKPLIFLLYVR